MRLGHPALITTIWPSPHIRRILLCRNSSGVPAVVVVKDHSLYIGGRHVPLPAQVRDATVLKLLLEDLVVLSFTSGWIVFLRIYDDGTVPLVVKAIPVGKGIFEGIEGLGYSLQMEPRSEAFAVTAFQEKISFFTIDKGNDAPGLDPSSFESRQRTTIFLDGCAILESCFLLPLQGSGDPTHCLYLALYARSDSKLYIRLYEWWTSRSIHEAQLYGTLPLPYNLVTHFVIPVRGDSAGVILVTCDNLFLVTISDVLSGRTKLEACAIVATPTTFYRDPLTLQNTGRDDHVYLFCENGDIYRVNVSGAKLMIKLFCRVGRDLGNSVVMQSASETGDILYDTPIEDGPLVLLTYGGDDSCGGCVLLSIDPEDPTKVQAQPEETYGNWSPLCDIAVVSKKGGRPQLFGCNGFESSGAFSQFRYGIKASIFMHGPPMRGVTGIFPATSDFGGPDAVHFLFISYPWETKVFVVDMQEGYPELRELDPDCGAIFGAETLSVKAINNSKWILQITKDRTVITDLETRTLIQSIPHNTTRADVVDGYALFVTVEQTSEGARTGDVLLTLCTIDEPEDYDEIMAESDTYVKAVGEPLRIKDSLLAATKMARVGTRDILLLGTSHPRLEIYTIYQDGLLQMEASIRDIFPQDDEDAIPYDFYVNETGRPDVIEVLVGLRNGSYIFFEWNFAIQELQLQTVRRIGHSPVEFTKIGGTQTLLVRSGQIHSLNTAALSFPSSTIVLDSEQKVSAEISCLCEAPGVQDGLFNYVIALMNGKLRILRMTQEPELVVRRLPIGFTPRRMQYLDFVGLMAVAITGGEKTGQVCDLVFVDPFRFEVVEATWGSSEDGQTNPMTGFASSETIYSLCQWSLMTDGKLYKFLVVGSGSPDPQGIIRIMRVQRTSSRSVILSVQHYWYTDGPVYSLGQFGESSIMYSSVENGSSVVTISTAETVEEKYNSGTLRSPVVQLTSHGTTIFASTLKSSLFVLEVRVEDREIVIVQADGMTRPTTGHFSCDEEFVVVADKNKYIAGLRRLNNFSATMATDFQFELPAVIMRIRALSISGGEEEKQPNQAEKSGNMLVLAGAGGSLYTLKFLTAAEVKILDSVLHDETSVDVTPPANGRFPIYPGTQFRDQFRNRDIYDGDALIAEHGHVMAIRDMVFNAVL